MHLTLDGPFGLEKHRAELLFLSHLPSAYTSVLLRWVTKPPSLCLGASISTIACVTRHFVLTTHSYFSILLLLDPPGKELIYFHSLVVLVPQEQGLIWTIMLVRAAIYWAFEQTRHLPEALLFWAALGLWCFESFSLFAESRGYSLPVVCRLLFAVVSLFTEDGL